MGFADVHAHLTHPKLEGRVGELVDRARAVGVTTVITAGLNASDNRRVRDLARRYCTVKPAFGLYPVEAVRSEMPSLDAEYPSHDRDDCCDASLQWIREHIDEAIAIGEIGLDGHWVPQPLWQKQDEVFHDLVLIALSADKPIIIHSRKREKRALEIVTELGAKKVLWHCFGGKLSLAKNIAERGHYLSIPSNARRADSFTRMLAALPRDRLLFETDCPYLAPERDQESEPADVVQTATFTAELWNVTVAEVKDRMTENFYGLFGVEP